MEKKELIILLNRTLKDKERGLGTKKIKISKKLIESIADFANGVNVKTAPHGAPDLSPICFAAHMHLNIWTPNFGIQEYVGMGNEQSKQLFKHNISVKDGMAYVGETAGLGVEFNEEVAMELPYKRSYLPVSRLEDGTVWNW